jgi:hypothetical protein
MARYLSKPRDSCTLGNCASNVSDRCWSVLRLSVPQNENFGRAEKRDSGDVCDMPLQQLHVGIHEGSSNLPTFVTLHLYFRTVVTPPIVTFPTAIPKYNVIICIFHVEFCDWHMLYCYVEFVDSQNALRVGPSRVLLRMQGLRVYVTCVELWFMYAPWQRRKQWVNWQPTWH